jgi:predicted ArsR family transcriptional regulator
MVVAGSVSDAQRRIVERLQRVDWAIAPDLADGLGITGAAVRQHLEALHGLGLVAADEGAPEGRRGRPALRWRLTPLARSLFPDRHADLTVELLGLMREELGEEAVDRIVERRAAGQTVAYRKALAGLKGRSRAARLAQLRTAEGYEAEVLDDDDSLLLIEHHCPVCDAASACQGLCRGELSTFRDALGDDVTVEREQHLLSGDSRCVYRIRSRRDRRAAPAGA